MNLLSKKPLDRIGYDFISDPYLPKGKDEYYLRDQQQPKGTSFRPLREAEILELQKQGSTADDWSDIYVSALFDPHLVRNCHFHGRVRIGALEPFYLEFHELRMPVGLYDSTIISCDLGDHVAIRNVDYLAYYIIGDEVMLFNINEMQTTSHAKFGNGILKQGEAEKHRIWLEIGNENGNRKVLPFAGMLPADACLWAKFRDDEALMDAFRQMTELEFDPRRGYYGTIGDRCIIKNSQSIKDVMVGSHAYIKGANKLKNLTIKSSSASPSQIGEGVEMVNGVMGYGSRAFYGVKAVRFILGENSTLKYGARLINSILGDNSTISCCEVLNSLIFPGHEQHHNNSFLIAATVLGQSNIAAGATIGSNHNSRGADGEIIAGRGFWPGLSVSLKHNSKFASFCLLTTGDFPAELDIPLPFALVSNNEAENCLDVIPAFWWLYNRYALTRNAWKYEDRDRRKYKLQAFENDYLAPDTIAELFHGLSLLENLTAKAWKAAARTVPIEIPAALSLGKYLLLEQAEEVGTLKITGEKMENSRREVRLLKVPQAYKAYRDMIHFYGLKTLLDYSEQQRLDSWEAIQAAFTGSKRKDWFNLGGQLIPMPDLQLLLEKIRRQELNTWTKVHEIYQQLERDYSRQNAANAYAALLELHGVSETEVSTVEWQQWLNKADKIAHEIARETHESRKKDYTNPFRQITFSSPEEMDAVQGSLADNPFIQQMQAEAIRFSSRISRWTKTGSVL